MTDVVIYARVSSKEQSEGYSIDAQLRLLREYADRESFTILKEYVEVETAKQAGRPVFQEMLGFIKGTPDCAVLVEKTDRLYRNIKDWVTVDELGVDIHFVKEGVVVGPNAKSSDKFFHGIRVLMAKNYIDNLSEEVRKGMKEKVLNGGWPHRPPYGYRTCKNATSVEPDPDTADILRWMFTRFAEGNISVHRLYQEFKQKSPKRLSPSNFEARLRDPFYKGVMRWKGDLYTGAYESLVDTDLWDKVQLLLDCTSALQKRTPTTGITYRGLIKCAHCGCAIVGEMKKGKYTYYHCSQKRGSCKENGWIRHEVLDKAFADLFEALRIPSDLQPDVVQALRDAHTVERTETEQQLAILNDKASELRRKLSAAYQDKLNSDISPQFWQEQHRKLEGDLKATYAHIDGYRSANLRSYEIGAQVLDFNYRAESVFLEGDIEVRRDIVNLVGSNCILRSGKLFATLCKPFDSLADIKTLPGRSSGEFGLGKNGRPYRDRTCDPLIKSQLLYQLS